MIANSGTASVGKEEQHARYAVSSRKIVAAGSDVHVKEFTLGAGEEVPWHRHTHVFDVFYCLEGRLEIERADVASGRPLEALVLAPGESAKVETNTAHRPHNRGPGVCRFLLVQGIGKYDYIAYRPAPPEAR